jgi:hypothetical protein
MFSATHRRVAIVDRWWDPTRYRYTPGIRVWDTETGTEAAAFDDHSAIVVALSGDGTVAVSLRFRDGSVMVWPADLLGS